MARKKKKDSDKPQVRIIANVRPRETRVAIVEDGRLAELKVEREQSVVGNVYLGRVDRLVPALDAAFVDIGLERNAFMHVRDALPEEPPRPRRGRHYHLPPIREVLREGQELLVQAVKGPVAAKGARITGRVSLAGKYAVLMAYRIQGRGDAGKVAVSRRIASDKTRQRLRRLGEELVPPGFGMILRTQSEDATVAELRRDIQYLCRAWQRIEREADGSQAPALVYQDLGIAREVLRDVFSEDMKSFLIDDEEVYHKVVELADALAPRLKGRIQLYQGESPVFHKFGIEDDIRKALMRTVRLPQGGHIGIDPTEALTVIDVNSGRFTKSHNLAETVLTTNLEAAAEIPRQLRLRDIGGIIVIDFIDMDKACHRRQVLDALRHHLARDRMKTRVVHQTPLGLVEMTRKRTGKTLSDKVRATCPTCGGEGHVLSPETVAIQIESRLHAVVREENPRAIRVIAHPQVAVTLLGPVGRDLDELETRLGKPLYVVGANRVHPSQFRVETGTKKQFDADRSVLRLNRIYAVRPHQVIAPPFPGMAVMLEGNIIFIKECSDELIEQGFEIKLRMRERGWASADVLTPDPNPPEVHYTEELAADEPLVSAYDLTEDELDDDEEFEFPEPPRYRERQPRERRRRRAPSLADFDLFRSEDSLQAAEETEPDQTATDESGEPTVSRGGRRAPRRRDADEASASPEIEEADDSVADDAVDEVTEAAGTEEPTQAAPRRRRRRRRRGSRSRRGKAGGGKQESDTSSVDGGEHDIDDAADGVEDSSAVPDDADDELVQPILYTYEGPDTTAMPPPADVTTDGNGDGAEDDSGAASRRRRRRKRGAGRTSSSDTEETVAESVMDDGAVDENGTRTSPRRRRRRGRKQSPVESSPPSETESAEAATLDDRAGGEVDTSADGASGDGRPRRRRSRRRRASRVR